MKNSKTPKAKLTCQRCGGAGQYKEVVIKKDGTAVSLPRVCKGCNGSGVK
jgi:DnaJ-class molecular chaperone